MSYTFHRYANLFPMMQSDEHDSLVRNISQFGLKEEIWLFQGQILDGRNRYQCCLEAGVTPRFREFKGTEEEALNAVLSWNLERRHLNPGQKAMVALEILPELERIAKEKQAAQAAIGAQFGRGHKKTEGEPLPVAQETLVANLRQGFLEEPPASPPVISPQLIQALANNGIHTEPVPTREPLPTRNPPATAKAAQAVGVSARSVQAAKKVQQARPDLAEKVLSGEMTLNQANTEVRREERIEKIAEISQGNRQLDVVADSPMAPEKFPVIYADPPWRYEHVKTDNRAIENQYPTMTLDEICDLPVSEISTPDAILFLWATSPKLAEALKVVDAWGFTYRTCAVWAKDKIGMGYYFRQQHELLLVCTRGSIPVPPVEARVSSVIHADRTQHSAKPSIFAEIIEKMYPELPKVELFCRSPRPGWFVWGNQSNATA